MSINIRNMTREDISRVGEILYEGFSAVAAKHGYTSNIDSLQEGKLLAWALFHHGPCERLVAEVENRVVGTTCLSLRGDFAGLGPTAIDPSCQDRAIGRELVSTVLKKAENLQNVRTFVEAFNSAIFSLGYFTLDLMPAAELLDLFLVEGVEQSLNLCSNVDQVRKEDIEEVCSYDRPRSKLDRRTDLEYFARWGKVFVYRYHSQIRGFLASLPGSRWVQLGPLLAEGEEEAETLFQHALIFFKKKNCRTRVMARDFSLAKALKKLGFRLYCVNILMVRGAWRPSQYIETFGYFPEGV